MSLPKQRNKLNARFLHLLSFSTLFLLGMRHILTCVPATNEAKDTDTAQTKRPHDVLEVPPSQSARKPRSNRGIRTILFCVTTSGGHRYSPVPERRSDVAVAAAAVLDAPSVGCAPLTSNPTTRHSTSRSKIGQRRHIMLSVHRPRSHKSEKPTYSTAAKRSDSLRLDLDPPVPNRAVPFIRVLTRRAAASIAWQTCDSINPGPCVVLVLVTHEGNKHGKKHAQLQFVRVEQHRRLELGTRT